MSSLETIFKRMVKITREWKFLIDKTKELKEF